MPDKPRNTQEALAELEAARFALAAAIDKVWDGSGLNHIQSNAWMIEQAALRVQVAVALLKQYDPGRENM